MCSDNAAEVFAPVIWEELRGLYEEFVDTRKSTDRTFELLQLTGLEQLAAQLGRELAVRFPDKSFEDIDAMVKARVGDVIAGNCRSSAG